MRLLNDMQSMTHAKNNKKHWKIRCLLRVRVYSIYKNFSENIQTYASKNLVKTRCVLWAICPQFGVDFGPLGTLLRPFWNPFGTSWGLLGASWGLPGASWAPLGRSWDALGRSRDTLGRLLDASWGALERSWGALGALLGPKSAPRAQNYPKMLAKWPQNYQKITPK